MDISVLFNGMSLACDSTDEAVLIAQTLFLTHTCSEIYVNVKGKKFVPFIGFKEVKQ